VGELELELCGSRQGVISWSHLVSTSHGDCGNLVSRECSNEEWWMTNSCWNFFPSFINPCIDIILIKIILTAPLKKLWGLQHQLNVLSKMTEQPDITGRKITL